METHPYSHSSVADAAEDAGLIRPERHELTSGEFTAVLGVLPSTMRRMVARRSSPLWTADTNASIRTEHSQLRRLVMIDDLDCSKLSRGAMLEIERMLSRPFGAADDATAAA